MSSASSTSGRPVIHRLHRRGNSSKSLDVLSLSEGQDLVQLYELYTKEKDKQPSRRKSSVDGRRQSKSRSLKKSHRSASTGDLFETAKSPSSSRRSLKNRNTNSRRSTGAVVVSVEGLDGAKTSRRSLESRRSSSTNDLFDMTRKSASSTRNLNSRQSLNSRGKSSNNSDFSDGAYPLSMTSSYKRRRSSSRRRQDLHRGSSTGDLSNDRHSSSQFSPSHQRKRRYSSQRSARSLNDIFQEKEEEEVSVKIGGSNIRQLHHSSSSFASKNRRRPRHSSQRSIKSLNDLFQEAAEDEEILIKFGNSKSRQIFEHSSTGSVSDLSISEMELEGLEYWDLEEFGNNSGDVDMKLIADDEEYFNSSGGDLRMIDEESAFDGNFEIEFAFNESKRRGMGSRQGSRRSMSSAVTVEDRMRVDEAFMSYTLAEKAALQIQRNFRRRKQMEQEAADTGLDKDLSDTDEEKGSNVVEEDPNSQSDNSGLYAAIFFAVAAAAAQLFFILIKCFGSNEADVPPIDTTVNAVSGGGGGGGAAPPPPGLEAMAGQAAASAGSSASTGVAAGGAAAGATSASAAAAATGAATATATTQVVTAVAVTSAVATAASTTGVFTPVEVVEPLVSRCGLIAPQNRVGKFAMVFEGFSRPMDDRESLVMEGLVLEAYNNLTIGGDLNATGSCLDPLSREMQDVKIQNQTYIPMPDGLSSLEIFFETSIVCDKCSTSRPLFKNEKEEESNETDQQQPTNDATNDQEQTVNENQNNSPNPTLNTTRLLQRKQSKRGLEDPLDDHASAFVDKSGADFFQRLIQKVIFETEESSKVGELPEGFVSVAQAYVTPTPIENGVKVETEGTLNDLDDNSKSLFTYVKYQKQDGKGAFEFSYVDEDSGATVTEVVVSDPADSVLNPIPSTPFPTFGPTIVREPTISPTSNPTIVFSGQPTLLPSVSPTEAPTPVPTPSPSTHPTINFSGQPTFEPSSNPSRIPSEVPTDAPSATPSTSPSDTPSYRPSVSPSSVPSIIPSDAPSTKPSQSPSDVPSVVPSESPSMVPSYVPSDVPSVNPSSQPSDVPSYNPSSQPSDAPSDNPSSSPSMVPSDAPSVSMMPSATPSDAPSNTPSESPSDTPSTVPSESPSDTPSMIPSMVPSDLPTVSMAPSAKPSAAPSDSPTVSFAPSISDRPTRFPTVSASPSASPSEAPKYWTVCGSTTDCQHTASVQSANNDRIGGTGLEIAVRCCADTELPDFTQVFTTCPWAESYIGGTCYYRATFYEAQALCASVQARLCTKDELEQDCTRGTGCNHNADLVWSSTPE